MSKTNWSNPSMLILTSNWGPTPSFSLIPANNTCPYIECLYNPAEKVLAIIGKTKKDTFHMIPRLDDDGRPIKSKTGNSQDPMKKQRVQQESYTEYYITNADEIENFIKNFAINADSFNYKKILDAPSMSNPDTIAKGPQLIVEK